MRKSKAVVSLLATVVIAWIAASVQAGGNPGTSGYDQDSWKTMIPAACRSFFDGCNQCRRAEDSDIAACTRKACAVYEKPRCLDAPITEGSIGKTPFEGKLAKFACEGDNRFRVYYGEYVSGDQRVRLGEDEIMLADQQSHSAYRLERVRAASGAKYSDGTLEFWEHGGEAMLRKEGQKLYQNCAVEG